LTPGWLERGARQALSVAGFQSRRVPTSVGEVHALHLEGGGALPPVVLVHGLGSAGLHFWRIMRLLQPQVSRVTAIDLPGHGFSDRPEALSLEVLRSGVLEALDQLQPEPAIVVGNSLGGAAVVRYAAQRPEKVLGAVLLAPAGAPMNAEELAGVRATFSIRSHQEAVAFLNRLLARPPGWKAHLVAPGIRRTFADPRLQAWLASLGDRDFLTPEEVRSVPPTVLVWGEHERILPGSALAFWSEHLPAHASIVRPERLGHSPHLDSATRSAELILEHARRVAELRAHSSG
jgi:pimeloyl-ACP methyl ester carboxylesterase